MFLGEVERVEPSFVEFVQVDGRSQRGKEKEGGGGKGVEARKAYTHRHHMGLVKKEMLHSSPELHLHWLLHLKDPKW